MNDVKSNGEMVAGKAVLERGWEAELKFTISPKRACGVEVRLC